MLLSPTPSAAVDMSGNGGAEHAATAISGPLQGGEGEFFFALDAFVATNGGSLTYASADASFGTVECHTGNSRVRVEFAHDLSWATAAGVVIGSCFDVEQQVSSPYAARFAVGWAATGPIERDAFISRPDGQVCLTVVRARDARAGGTLTWSAPGLGIGGTGEPFGLAGIDETDTRCRPA
jgi:hypothetical protein